MVYIFKRDEFSERKTLRMDYMYESLTIFLKEKHN